jgi:hypothetical protein
VGEHEGFSGRDFFEAGGSIFAKFKHGECIHF